MTEPTINGLLIAAITTLGGVVGYLWKQLSAQYKEIQDRSQDCDDDRRNLWAQVAILNAEVENCKEQHQQLDGLRK